MRVSQIVSLCNQLCNLELPVNCDSSFTISTAHENATLRKLIVCCNTVLEDLYCNYFTVIATCEVTATGGVIDTSKLDFCRVLKLTDKNGNNVRYRYTENGLFAEDGDYLLTYAKRPAAVDWFTEVVLPSSRISERVVVYGMLAEYFLAVEDLELALAWETRYQNALHAASIKNSSMTLPVGKWC